MNILVVLCLIFSQDAISFPVHSYLIPAKMKPGWVTIEYENPKCESLKEFSGGREFVIPESGYLCTSSSMYMGWAQRRYFVVEEGGRRTPLKVKKHIWREASFRINESDCKVVAEEYFYGKKVTHENAILFDEKFLEEHPGCRNRGINTKLVP